MTFDEWWPSYRDMNYQGDSTMEILARRSWITAQREAARRCAEICGQQGTAVTHVVSKFIEREFGLDRHE